MLSLKLRFRSALHNVTLNSFVLLDCNFTGGSFWTSGKREKILLFCASAVFHVCCIKILGLVLAQRCDRAKTSHALRFPLLTVVQTLTFQKRCWCSASGFVKLM